jgi:class 3 adenylate cyclase
MIHEAAETIRVEKTVLCFDICSSTRILENLLETGNEARWKNLILALKDFLQEEQRVIDFEIYKFLGDGWVLLFDPHVHALLLKPFLTRLCDKFDELFAPRIGPRIDRTGIQSGISMGLDFGTLIRIKMNDRIEYLGRPLNVANRLQDTLKQDDGEQAPGQLMVSQGAYHELRFFAVKGPRDRLVSRRLRNIYGDTKHPMWKLAISEPNRMR